MCSAGIGVGLDVAREIGKYLGLDSLESGVPQRIFRAAAEEATLHVQMSILEWKLRYRSEIYSMCTACGASFTISQEAV